MHRVRGDPGEGLRSRQSRDSLAGALITIYQTDHPHSQVLCRAISLGVKSRVVPPVELLPGPAVVYGILRGCGEIIRQCEWVGRDYFHIDHGYVGRGHYEGYYRLSKNGLQWDGSGEFPADRWSSLRTKLSPWRKSGRSVVVCPVSRAVADFYGIDTHKWLKSVVSELSQFTDRPVIVKPKDEGDLRHVLNDCFCLVAHQSNAATEAILQGIPAIVLGPSAAAPVARTRLRDVETPLYADREPWCHGLAYHQWTIDEMRKGLCWEYLNDLPGMR